MNGRLLVQNAMMVLPNRIVEGDLRVSNGLIKTVAPFGGLQPEIGELVIDGTGLHLLPGVIDPHVHFRDPGNPEKEDLESGSRAAAAGGITSFLDMPNTSPNATNRLALEEKIAAAAKKAVTHHGFFIGATTNNVSDLQSVQGMDGICGIKIFMGSSTGNLLVHEQKHLEHIFANTGGIIATHAEDEIRLQSRIAEFKHRTDIAAHAECRDIECALIATKRATALAKDHSHRLHIVHLTSGKEADWLSSKKGDLITTEVCTQHLTFDQDDVEKLGVRALMNPPIRYTEDKEKLWSRLKDGTIDCIVTDHAPHTLEAKSVGFPKAPAGMPGVETSLPRMLTHAKEGKCSISDIVRWMCAGPAKVYQIKNKGSLIEGFDGDLTLVDLENHRIIQDSDTWTRVGWTPYDGMELTGWPMYTIVDGNVVHKRDSGGALRGSSVALAGSTGRVLKFN
ncbi:MAG: dihydroorotase [Candidatus Poseidoniales archaeon]|uniref:Dihydroorotase, multifunctional complex type (URA4, pyrC) n=1 Tax=uncultured Poseidoniia archaeon TaxID=1697135 RepID=A0A1B1T8T3_9ARCH|nr:dihydroorotase, multifunctional complex type (URA4, pyrC) [uncultured Candidatus Thalassoarchaea sp.]MDC0155565.1 dihydroorotase [Euryarchaeota archaeon]RCH72947.1 MAG: dihydroorotase [Candidatus Poseidoniales archaeon]|tara:strand:+ start:8693 stop:10045 length:1353 start_codon:yes stop_codon:yes gene_type:complete